MELERVIPVVRLRGTEPKRYTRTGGWLVPVEQRMPADSMALVILLAITVALVGFAAHWAHRGYETGAVTPRGQLIDRLA